MAIGNTRVFEVKQAERKQGELTGCWKGEKEGLGAFLSTESEGGKRTATNGGGDREQC